MAVLEPAYFKHLVNGLSYGKSLPQAIYVYRYSEACQDGALGSTLATLANSYQVGEEYNVVKFRRDAPRLSFLSYPRFEEDPHPVLKSSLAIDLVSGKTYATDYRDNPNPPILHRKELLVPGDDARSIAWAALSCQEELAGLYSQTSTIGFQANWNRLLADRGLAIDGYCLKSVGPPLQVDASARDSVVLRHRTAITRYQLSKPVKTLIEYNQLEPASTLFDYGCGLGADVRGLQALGFAAQGWDPTYAPDVIKASADIVNLGFVLNVIEDPIERADVLAEAWSLATRLLVVSVMIRGTSGTREGSPFQDGIITSRQTFQRYFGQQEFQQYLEEGLHCSAIPIALGVFYVFRNPEEHQSFLQRRSRRTIAWEPLSGPPEDVCRSRSQRKPRVSERPARIDRYEEHRNLLESFWSTVAALGRVPEDFEFAQHSAIVEHFGSSARALRLLLRNGRAEAYETIRAARRGDLVVYLACANLRNKVPFSQLPATVQVDIREMFGSYARGLDEGLRMLFTAGDSTNVVLACDDANVGWQDSGALYCHSRFIAELPPLLRVYIGCAELLYGDARQADIVKIHKTSGKVSFFSYNDFDQALLPELVLRTKVNLRTQCVDVYDHLGQGQLLYFKERFLTNDDHQYCALLSLGDELRRLGISDATMIGPTMVELATTLTSARRDDLLALIRCHKQSEHPDD